MTLCTRSSQSDTLSGEISRWHPGPDHHKSYSAPGSHKGRLWTMASQVKLWTRSLQGHTPEQVIVADTLNQVITGSHRQTNIHTPQDSSGLLIQLTGCFWSVGVSEENIPQKKASEVDLVTIFIERAGLVSVFVCCCFSVCNTCLHKHSSLSWFNLQ